MALEKQNESYLSPSEELLSSLMDNEFSETSADELVEKMIDDESLLSKWESYHLIRDVLQTNQASLSNTARTVSQRLQLEPCISGKIKANDGKMTKPKSHTFDWHLWWRPATGFALACSLFVLVAQLIQTENSEGTDSLAIQEKNSQEAKVHISDAVPITTDKKTPNTLIREHFIEHQYAAPLRNTSNAKLVGYDPNAQ